MKSNVLQESLRVQALRPGTAAYDAAARAFFGRGCPAMVARPRSVDEVGVALQQAVRRGWSVAVRSGGHSPLGGAASTDAMLIDLTHLDAVEVLDADRRRVRVGAGATWGLVATALERCGWAITAGDTADVGVGGLTLGGGIGWMVRQHGLTIDNLVSARVVTADGRLRTASASEHSDLFWALRGGGGNFGVVVDFDFIAQPVGPLHFGTLTYELQDLGGFVAGWSKAMASAPDELSSTVALPPRAPGVRPSVIVMWCHAAAPGEGPAQARQQADAALAPLRRLGTLTASTLEPRSYPDILEVAAEPPAALRLTARNSFATSLSPELLGAIADVHSGTVPTALAIRSLGGEFGRIPQEATAFAHRDATALVVALFMLPATQSDADDRRALGAWERVAELGTGTYVGFQGSATQLDIESAYPQPTRARLEAIKRTYDPLNLLSCNHNIHPAGEPCPTDVFDHNCTQEEK